MSESESPRPTFPGLVAYAETQPEPLRSDLLDVVEVYIKHREYLNGIILGCEQNSFSVHDLNEMKFDMLERAAKLAARGTQQIVPLYLGRSPKGGTTHGNDS